MINGNAIICNNCSSLVSMSQFRITAAACILCILYIVTVLNMYENEGNSTDTSISASLSYQKWNHKNLPEFLIETKINGLQNWTFSDGKTVYDFNITMEEMPALVEGWRRDRPKHPAPVDIMAMVSIYVYCV